MLAVTILRASRCVLGVALVVALGFAAPASGAEAYRIIGGKISYNGSATRSCPTPSTGSCGDMGNGANRSSLDYNHGTAASLSVYSSGGPVNLPQGPGTSAAAAAPLKIESWNHTFNWTDTGTSGYCEGAESSRYSTSDLRHDGGQAPSLYEFGVRIRRGSGANELDISLVQPGDADNVQHYASYGIRYPVYETASSVLGTMEVTSPCPDRQQPPSSGRENLWSLSPVEIYPPSGTVQEIATSDPPVCDQTGKCVVHARGSTSVPYDGTFGGDDVRGSMTITWSVDVQIADGECRDGHNNDFDALTDFPFDPGCTSSDDPSELGTTVCDNGTDDDADGFIDDVDEGCDGPLDEDETNVDEVTLTTDVMGPGVANGCTSTCTTRHKRGGLVTFTAVPDEPNDGFLAWEGCDSVVGATCLVRLHSDRTIKAMFDPVVTYAPWVRFSKGERRYPMDPGEFVRGSSLKWANIGSKKYKPCTTRDKLKVSKGDVDPAKLSNGLYSHRYCYRVRECRPVFAGGHAVPTCSYGPKKYRRFTSDDLTSPSKKKKPGRGKVLGRSGFFLDLDNDFRSGVTPSRGAAHYSGPLMYVEYKPGRYIIYWFFSGQNDATVARVRDLHEGDWEHIVVRLDARNRTIEMDPSIAYYAHYCNTRRYAWAYLAKVGWLVNKTHPTVWVSRGSHASYADEGTDLIAGDCRNPMKGVRDTRTKGVIWETWQKGRAGFREATTESWYGFGGGWGHEADSTSGFPGPFWGPLGPGPLKYDDGASPADW